MPAVYENQGIRFLYPENWSVMEEETTDWPRTVTVQSEHTAFWTLLAYPPRSDTGPAIDHIIETIREEYRDLEILEGKDVVDGALAKGVNICFFYLDLLVEAKIRCVQTPSYTLIWHYQAETREFEQMEPVFQAISTSMMSTQAPLPSR